MTVRRIVGMETEFGILEPSEPGASPIALSADLVEAYERRAGASTGWDFHGEDPLNDARGYRLDRGDVHPSLLTDSPEASAPAFGEVEQIRDVSSLRRPRAANLVLTNGARLYVDHAHPEYSSPETASPRAAVLWDRAGEAVAIEAMEQLRTEGREVAVYKNNVDGKGAAYGSHENYLMSREASFADVVRYMTPFFVTRPLLCGAGRVGLGQASEFPGFQISQRADYVENDVGLETTFNRPIINTRDEPHADYSLYRRLHVIGGDANLFDVSNLLKVGSTCAVLWLIEIDEVPLALDSVLLHSPVAAAWQVSHDPFAGLDMHDGSAKTALDIQRIYLAAVREAVERRGGADSAICSIGATGTPRPRWSSGRPNADSSKECANAAAWRGTTPNSAPSICNGTICGPASRSSKGSTPPAKSPVSSAATTSSGPRRRRRRTPAHSSGEGLWPSSLPPFRRRDGTASSSTTPANSCVCRPFTRTGGPRRTSGRCSLRRATRRISSGASARAESLAIPVGGRGALRPARRTGTPRSPRAAASAPRRRAFRHTATRFPHTSMQKEKDIR